MVGLSFCCTDEAKKFHKIASGRVQKLNEIFKSESLIICIVIYYKSYGLNWDKTYGSKVLRAPPENILK